MIADGPVHVYLLVLGPGVADKVAVPPAQIGPLFVGAADGVALTVTAVDACTMLTQPVPG